MKNVQLTKEGFENLKSELKKLIDETKPYAINRLHHARAMGDLKENSEYSAAKEELAFVEGRILEIEQVLRNVQIMEHNVNNSVVDIGTKVTVETDGSKILFHIVGEFEADPMNKKLSVTSPIGKALLGKKIGDNVNVTIPAGIKTYKIIEIR
ncbi:MAG: transcription elongation factor GreA [bacterium]|nr:transcription elongation factor GreA [bacterium]